MNSYRAALAVGAEVRIAETLWEAATLSVAAEEEQLAQNPSFQEICARFTEFVFDPQTREEKLSFLIASSRGNILSTIAEGLPERKVISIQEFVRKVLTLALPTGLGKEEHVTLFHRAMSAFPDQGIEEIDLGTEGGEAAALATLNRIIEGLFSPEALLQKVLGERYLAPKLTFPTPLEIPSDAKTRLIPVVRAIGLRVAQAVANESRREITEKGTLDHEATWKLIREKAQDPEWKFILELARQLDSGPKQPEPLVGELLPDVASFQRIRLHDYVIGFGILAAGLALAATSEMASPLRFLSAIVLIASAVYFLAAGRKADSAPSYLARLVEYYERSCRRVPLETLNTADVRLYQLFRKYAENLRKIQDGSLDETELRILLHETRLLERLWKEELECNASNTALLTQVVPGVEVQLGRAALEQDIRGWGINIGTSRNPQIYRLQAATRRTILKSVPKDPRRKEFETDEAAEEEAASELESGKAKERSRG